VSSSLVANSGVSFPDHVVGQSVWLSAEGSPLLAKQNDIKVSLNQSSHLRCNANAKVSGCSSFLLDFPSSLCLRQFRQEHNVTPWTQVAMVRSFLITFLPKAYTTTLLARRPGTSSNRPKYIRQTCSALGSSRRNQRFPLSLPFLITVWRQACWRPCRSRGSHSRKVSRAARTTHLL
jgi:hypothetical protein